MENINSKVSCFLHAYHNKTSGFPVFADTAAELMLGDDYGKIAQSFLSGADFFLPGVSGKEKEILGRIINGILAPAVLGRSAFAEAALKTEQRLGTEQIVLFGAGYDTYAMRHPEEKTAVFELDRGAVLKDKRRRAEEAGLKTFAVDVPCDLAGNAWKKALTASGFRKGKKSFSGMLGLCHYLEKESFGNLPESLRTMVPEGSALVFDYPVQKESTRETVRILAAGAGESMKAAYSPEEIETLLSECGFLVYEHLTNEEMTERFFSEHNCMEPSKKMAVPEGTGCVLAVAKG